MIPAVVPAGAEAHRRSATVRSGSTASNVDAWRSIRRRVVVVSGTTSQRDARTRQPRSAAIRPARRTLRSMPASVAWTSGIALLTSMTRREPVGAWNASTSIEPRSP